MAKGKKEAVSKESQKADKYFKIVLGGEERLLRAGFMSAECFIMRQSDNTDNGNIKILTDIVYSTHFEACVIKSVKCPSYEDVSEWIDEALLEETEVLKDVVTWFNNSPIIRKVLNLDKAA